MNPACSYIQSTPVANPLAKPFTNITQPGAAQWANGTVTDKALAFPPPARRGKP